MPENTLSIEAYRDEVVQIVQSSLEEIGFMEIIEAEEPSAYDENLNRYRAEILINEPSTGEVQLIMSKELLETIAKNVYAIEPGAIGDEIMNDTMAEMINIIAGGLMRLWTPPAQVFQLGLPSVGKEAFLKIETCSNTIEFDMEGEHFWLVLRGDTFSNPPRSSKAS